MAAATLPTILPNRKAHGAPAGQREGHARPSQELSWSAIIRCLDMNSRCSMAAGVATRPLIRMDTASTRITGVALTSPRAVEIQGAAATTAVVRSALVATAMVLTVGAMPRGSSGHRTMARLTPSSLKLRIASKVTMAIAKTPNSLGPSTRAKAMPIARVPRRETTVFAKLQPRARDARPARGGAPSAIDHRGAERRNHQLLLNLGQVREHGQRQDLRRRLLSHRACASRVAEVGVRGCEMPWVRVVQSGADPGRGQLGQDAVALHRDTDHVQVPDVRVAGHGPGNPHAWDVGQQLGVASCRLPPALVPSRQSTQLGAEGDRMNRVQPRVHADDLVPVLHGRPVGPHEPY